MKTFLTLTLLTASLFADPVQEPTTPPDQPAAESAPTTDQQPAPMDAAVPTMDQPAQQEEPGEQEQTDMEPLCVSDEYGSFILNEFKMGYFRSGSKKLCHIYDDGLLDLQLTSSFRVWKPLYIYAAIEYISAEGRTLDGHKKTKMRIVPLSLGLQYIQPITFDLKYYLTAGPRYFFFHQKNYAPGVPSKVNNSGCGGFVNTGFIYYLTHHITVDLFGEYSYKRMRFDGHRADVSGHTVQVGGLTLGGGIGYFW